MHAITTIGYETTTIPSLLVTLQEAKVDLLVDVRAVASSRRPGFAKSKLAANLEGAGIAYLHLRGLGTPAEGRAAARSGRHEEMLAIFREHLTTAPAQDDLETLVELVRSGRKVCLLCLEANPVNCHRSLVVEALARRLPLEVNHLESEVPKP